MNCSHVCALGSIFMHPWLWGSCKAVRISLSISLPFVLSLAPSSLCHPTVSLSVFYIHEGTGVCTRTSRRIVLDVARTFADWRLVEITRSKPTVFLSLSPSLSLFELQQVQFTSIGTKRMQKWIGRHERLTSLGPMRKKGHNAAREQSERESWPRTTR